MPNHVHALIQTPEPNLARGMQHWLSGYANWYAKRNQRTGHLYQGRYKAFLVEDAGYYWTLSRYIHLNPCNGSKPLTSRRIKSVSFGEIIHATALAHEVSDSDHATFRSRAAGRDMAAWLCRRWTGATLKELGVAFGVNGIGSVSNLVRRAEQRRKESRTWSIRQLKIETSLGLKTQHKA